MGLHKVSGLDHVTGAKTSDWIVSTTTSLLLLLSLTNNDNESLSVLYTATAIWYGSTSHSQGGLAAHDRGGVTNLYW